MREVLNTIVWLCRPYANSGNAIYFYSELLKCRKNRQVSFEKGDNPFGSVVLGVHCRSYVQRGYGDPCLLLPERSTLMAAGICLLECLCRNLVWTVEPGKLFQSH